MKRINLLVGVPFTIFLVGFLITTVTSVFAVYDSTSVLACSQKYFIPENVYTGDYVGYWLKTFSYNSGNTINYSKDGTHPAFEVIKINNDSALITISNPIYINGEIVTQDAVYYLPIRTTDVGSGYYEIDTAVIWIKENSYCKFIDYNYSGTESGTRTQPYNSFSDIKFTAGYGYFVKCDNAPTDKTYNLAAVNASAANPTVISSYGDGDLPHFDGNDLSEEYYLFKFNATSNHVKVCNLYVSHYPAEAFEVATGNTYFGFYNCYFYNNMNEAYQSDMADIYFKGSSEELNIKRHHECINIKSIDTRGAIVKCDASNVYIDNAYQDNYDDMQASFRIATKYNRLRYFYCKNGAVGVHFKNRENLAEQGYVESCTVGVQWAHETAYPDSCYLKNVKIIDCPTGLEFYGTGIDSALVENCWIENTTTGINNSRGGNYKIFRYNRFKNNTNDFEVDNEDEPPSNMYIYYNIFEGASTNEIYIYEGSTIYVYNNFVDGTIECLNATSEVVRGNFYRTLSHCDTESKNIDLVGISIDNYFVDYSGHNYHLKSTAISAIDQGYDWGQSQDYECNLKYGDYWDIGAYEYSPEDVVADIIYIDPENKNDVLEDGSLEHPYDSWQDVEWISGFSYLQRSGTIANEPKILVTKDQVFIGSYGEGEQPVIWSTAEDYAFSFFEKTNLTIQNIHIVAENAISSLYFLGDISDHITIENSKFEGSIYGIRIVGGNNFTIQYNTFRETSQGIYSYAVNTEIYYNIFQNNQDALTIDGENSSAEIYNNVFYDNNTAVTTELSEITLYNNVFYLSKATDKAIEFNGTQWVSDHNIYYPSQDGFISYNGQPFHDLAELQQVQGIDMNSLVSDPLFVDAFNHNFDVENESPAIDAGIYVGITADLLGEGVPYGNNPDIGVIEVPVAVNPISFISAKEPNDLLQVFPNPSNGIFSICMDNPDQEQANVHIRDINGHTMLEKQYSDQDTRFEQLLDISDFPAGIYILSLKIANSLYSRRIVKIF